MSNARTHHAPRPTPLVGDYMTATPHTIGAEQTVARARQMMIGHQIRHLPVLDDGHLVGIVTDRDLRLAWETDAHLPVTEYMQSDVYSVHTTQSLAEVARHMADHKLGSAVVMEHIHVTGIITAVDLANALADVLEAHD